MMPAGVLQSLGGTNAVLGWAAIAFGFILEIGLTYVLLYFPARFLIKRFYDLRAQKAMACERAASKGGIIE